MNSIRKFEMLKTIGLNNQLKADFMMIMVTMFWGSSYLFMKMGLHSIQEFNLIALRFGIAFILAGIIFYKRLCKMDLHTFKAGFILGTILFLALTVVTIGLTFTSISNAGFLFSLTVVFVPLLIALFFRKKPEKKIVIGVLFSIVGIALLTLNQHLQISSGDFLIILGALFYAIYIIVTDKLTKNVDSITLGVLQLGFTGAWALLFSFWLEQPHLPTTSESWFSILALSILCSAVGFIGQTAAQKYTTPTHTGLIFSLEPVFAAILAYIFVDEVLSARGYLGATLVLIGVLAAKIDFKHSLIRKGIRKTINESQV
ncbi:drug/metabolite transporter (DMT)-like permease [Peribacillus huizhouensis]|uniref:Drug/metabolite transporter (DMT)-like permease n=1 Tax=Peribacillus huizhouensis TaxID=1501239 RepID=A0ABR6CME0_9BACI|nr:drug/metabolite transporter (DMT)-like permease [Peribacillus huizhouensis]